MNRTTPLGLSPPSGMSVNPPVTGAPHLGDIATTFLQPLHPSTGSSPTRHDHPPLHQFLRGRRERPLVPVSLMFRESNRSSGPQLTIASRCLTDSLHVAVLERFHWEKGRAQHTVAGIGNACWLMGGNPLRKGPENSHASRCQSPDSCGGKLHMFAAAPTRRVRLTDRQTDTRQV